VRGVVAYRPVQLVGVVADFCEAAAVEHVESRCVGAHYRVAVEVRVGPNTLNEAGSAPVISVALPGNAAR
jgi:hypothetical protein